MVSIGGSVANARAPNVSITKLTQRSCTAFRGESLKIAEPKNTIAMAETLTASWNYRNFLTLSYTLRPNFRATTIEPKLSSKRMMSEAACATSVPVIPIEKPTSALLNAGASFVPSPVTATTSSQPYKPVTKIFLSSGLHLAMTLKFLWYFANSFAF